MMATCQITHNRYQCWIQAGIRWLYYLFKDKIDFNIISLAQLS